MSVLRRIVLALSYDGSRYHGWQHQQDVNSVQQTVEHAISRVANHPVTVVCAGRTDAGVHASCQIIHFDTTSFRANRSWIFGTNSNLPHDIAVHDAKEVPLDFHARFSALARTYRYVLYPHTTRPGILQKAVGWHYQPLDVEAMQAGGNYLIGEHDFSAFRGSGCQAKHAVRTIHHLYVRQQGQLIIIEVKANGFLLHMVRNIVGVLLEIGEGVKTPAWAESVLHSRDRRQAGLTCSPYGLYLVQIDYPEHYGIPTPTKGPFFL